MPAEGTLMVMLRIRLHLDDASRVQVVGSLLRIVEPVRTMTGCLGCQLYADIEDSGVLLFSEEWNNEQALAAHFRTDEAKVLLSALEYASETPEVEIHTESNRQGMDWIAKCCGCAIRVDG
jgi:quinol monooxygenase YgiN